MSTTITPYLFYNGRCDEALQFYKERLGATIEMVMRFNESPDPVPPGMLEPGFETKVMHASLTIGGARLMVADGCDSKGQSSGYKLALQVKTEAEAHKFYDALADGGTVQMPLTKTFWSPCFGMVEDRFKIEWMVMVPGEM